MKIRVSGSYPVQMAVVVTPGDEPNPDWDAAWSSFSIRGPDGVERPVQMEAHELTHSGEKLRSFEAWFESVGIGEYELVPERKATHDKRVRPGRYAEAALRDAPVFLLDGRRIQTFWVMRKDGTRKYERHGEFAATAQFIGEHLIGYVTVFDGRDDVLVEMIFHNCEPRSSDLFFDTLEYVAPMSVIGYAWPEPRGAGAVLIQGRQTGEQYVLPRKSHREFRFVACHYDSPNQSGLAAYSNVAIAEPAIVGAQRIEMPNMASETAAVAGKVSADLQALFKAIATKTQVGTAADPNKPGAYGFMPFWGGNYGGATSGSYRFPVEGWQARVPAVDPALVLSELGTRAMMVCNRTPGIVLEDGRPVRPSEWSGGWDVSSSDLLFERNGALPDQRDGDFDFAQAPMVVDPARFPEDDWSALSTYSTDGSKVSPIDWQHFDRCFQPDAGKAELCGAPISKLRLRAFATMAQMSWVTSGFMFEADFCGRNPGTGTTFGRGEAHMAHLLCHAYRYAPNGERQVWAQYLSTFARALVAAQMVNGLFQAKMRKENTDPKNSAYVPLGQGRYAVAKITEEALLANALYAVHETAPLGLLLAQAVREALVRWADSGLWAFAWRKGATGGAPVDYVCVRPAARLSAPLARWWNLPPIVVTDAAGNVLSSTPVPGYYGHDLSETAMGLGAGLEYHGGASLLRDCAFHYCGRASSAAQARAWLLARADWDERLGLLRALESMP